MVKKKKKAKKSVKVCRNPWFKKNKKNDFGFVPINWKGWLALILLIGINIFGANYFNLKELVVDDWLKMGVVFLLSIFVFAEFSRRKSVEVKE